MPLQPEQLGDDFRDFLISLNAVGVEYLLINKQPSGRTKDRADFEKLSVGATSQTTAL